MSASVSSVLPSRYAGVSLLAVGGMGEVYVAEDSALRRPVALKLLAERFVGDEAVRRRFLREANAAAQLSGHPNVVTIYDVGEWQGRPFIAMEYLPDGDLRGQISRGRPAIASVLAWVAQAASAIDAAHRIGIVHRDVKPANLLLDGQSVVHVADFGIARIRDQTTGWMTLPGTIMGTAGYISPEQARGEAATSASDIYSLGAVGYELVTGSRPFQRSSEPDELAAHVHARLPRASQTAGVPAAVDAVFERVMAKDPAARYPTAEAFSAQLAAAVQAAEQPTLVSAPEPRAVGPMSTYGQQRSNRRTALLVLMVAATTLLAGLGVAYALSRAGGSAAPSVRTVTRKITVQHVTTRQGTTVTVPETQTQTVTVPANAPPSDTAGHDPPSSTAGHDFAAGHMLNDQGYAAMQRGDYPAALGPLAAAVRDLRGAGPADPYEAYANYNLGYTLLELDRCTAAIAPLTRAERLETSPAVPAALRRAHACAP